MAICLIGMSLCVYMYLHPSYPNSNFQKHEITIVKLQNIDSSKLLYLHISSMLGPSFLAGNITDKY